MNGRIETLALGQRPSFRVILLYVGIGVRIFRDGTGPRGKSRHRGIDRPTGIEDERGLILIAARCENGVVPLSRLAGPGSVVQCGGRKPRKMKLR